ncbi:MAG: tetratricopeptide repeat protein [Sandaracinaceae bacterium]
MSSRLATYLAISIVALTPTTALAIPDGADGRALHGAASAMMELRLADARQTLERLAREYPEDPDVRFERALLRFYLGEYAGAVSDLDAVGDRGTLRSEADRAELTALIRATEAATRSFETARSPDGRYVVRYAPGPDAVLVPWALDAMAAADRAIGEELGVRVPGPIRLEIYPSAAGLADVSSLTVENIATSGTIALCKWDRLMVTSPRALVRGYPWMDTIGHELVHLFLTRASRDRAPVWFQEGVAKFLERRWRGEPPEVRLDPASEGLLHAAVEHDELLPFERLHPSIALLPSQEQAALAFAQVATFVEGFYHAHGRDGLQRAVTAMAHGDDAREALAEVAGSDWDDLERAWRVGLRSRPPPPTDPPRMLTLRLASGEGAAEEASDVVVEEARRHLRLGDLLWDRQRPAAASVEYGRAHDAAPDDPIVASRFARAALDGGRPAEAVRALARFRERYPEHAPTWAVSGAAWLALGERGRARDALLEAIRLNPFDPAVSCDLAEATDVSAERVRARDACGLLRRTR